MARPARLPAVAARNALRGVLLLGGLFALGLLLGGQAQAADGALPAAATPPGFTPPVLTTPAATVSAATAPAATVSASATKAATASVPRTVAEPFPPYAASGSGTASGPDSGSGSGPVSSAPAPASASNRAPAPVSTPAPAPAGETPADPTVLGDLLLPVRGRVVESAGAVLGGVSERVTVVVAEVVPTASLPSVSELPTPPSPGSFPELPDAPSLPSLPALAPSARTLPVPELPILPVPGLPVPDRPVPDPGPDSGAVDPAAPRPPYGPLRLVREAPTGPVAHGGGQVRAGRAVTGTPAPAERAPAGLPDGARAGASQPDGGTPRHGDAHAVTSHQRVPLPSAPGSAVRTDAAGTEDRYRDIPVFPG